MECELRLFPEIAYAFFQRLSDRRIYLVKIGRACEFDMHKGQLHRPFTGDLSAQPSFVFPKRRFLLVCQQQYPVKLSSLQRLSDWTDVRFIFRIGSTKVSIPDPRDEHSHGRAYKNLCMNTIILIRGASFPMEPPPMTVSR
jgi:hypothetical protein